MKVRNDIQNKSVITKGSSYKPGFGAKVPTSYEVAELAKATRNNLSKSSGLQKTAVWFENRANSVIENLNNQIAAFGTAFIAPIFIINNPLSKRDKETKKYSAWRQPISAVLSLGVMLPLNNVWVRYIDKLAHTGGVEGYDLAARPPVDILKKMAARNYAEDLATKKRLEQTKRTLTHDEKSLMERFGEGKTKATYIADEVERLRAAAFSKVVEERRKENIFLYEGNDLKKLNEYKAQIKAQQAIDNTGTIYHQVIAYKDMAKPEHFDKALEVVTREEAVRHLKAQGIHNITAKDLEAAKVSDIDSLNKHLKKLKKENKLGKEIDFKKLRESIKEGIQDAKKIDASKVNGSRLIEKAAELAKIDYKTEYDHKEALTEIKNRLMELFNIEQDKELELINKTKDRNKWKISVPDNRIKEIKDQLYNTEVETWAEKASKVQDKTDDISQYVYDKLKRIQHNNKNPNVSALDLLRSRGKDPRHIQNSVLGKLWESAKAFTNEKRFENTKQIAGSLITIAIGCLVVCTVLNWVHPRFIDRYLPHLSKNKDEKPQGKEGNK